MLKADRPPDIIVLSLVRDAAVQLLDRIGTRADVCVLIRDSQYIVEEIPDNLDSIKEDDPPDVGDMEVDEGRAKVVSFKDKLLGWVSNDNQKEDFDEDKFELIKRDVITGLEDGIPDIKFSERVHTWIQRSMAKTVIIKLLGWKIRFNNLVSKLNSMWKLNSSFQLMDLESLNFKQRRIMRKH
ncbi:hypothetical protein J1N35_043844 [Gossypium stocksii]|uniref:Nuclear factor related to kappa-B-binding protein second winged helix domain-containing protein n=1 Tax=Gossypium stocksii TaxID=47602 RepID=A0A9D3ZFG3_9ROSI|nr:hypothetical protein J1N35_043844 [Gossypium stocksii]